jgi:hypothetical protein
VLFFMYFVYTRGVLNRMSVENVVAEILQLKQEFEALCEEAETQVEALQTRLSEVYMPPGTQEVSLTVPLVHARLMAASPQSAKSTLVLVWSFQTSTFQVREQNSNVSTALLDRTDDWAFIELVAAIPKLLPKIEASVGANLPEKKLILAAARAALEACATTGEGERPEPANPAAPARFQHIG